MRSAYEAPRERHWTRRSASARIASWTTIPFTPAKLLELYPTHEDYVQQYSAAADEALATGYLLQADYDEVVAQAQAAPIPP